MVQSVKEGCDKSTRVMVKLNDFSMKIMKALENCIRVLALPVLEVFHGQYTVLFFLLH